MRIVISSSEATIERLVREVMPRRLQSTSLNPAMLLRGDLGIDSFGLISLAFRLEEEFSLDLFGYADDVAAVQTIGDVVGLVQRIKNPSSQ